LHSDLALFTSDGYTEVRRTGEGLTAAEADEDGGVFLGGGGFGESTCCENKVWHVGGCCADDFVGFGIADADVGALVVKGAFEVGDISDDVLELIKD
jgi:hypothetical protein